MIPHTGNKLSKKKTSLDKSWQGIMWQDHKNILPLFKILGSCYASLKWNVTILAI